MKVERKDLDALTAELRLVIEKEDYLPEYQKQLQDFQKKAQLKGFRKGKTPMSIIKKMYGAATMQESVSKVLGEKLNEIVTGEEYNIIGEPLFLDEDNVPEIDHTSPEDYSYTFEIGLEPEFEPVGASEEDSYTQYSMIIDEKIIDEEMEIAQQRLGEQKETNEKIEEGDIIYLDVTEMEGGKEKEDGFTTTFSVNFDNLSEKYKKELKAKSTGDKLTVNVYELEENMTREIAIKYLLGINPEEEGAVVPDSEEFAAVISKVTRVVNAEMNQDFFDKYFGKDQVTSVEEAREKIKSFLSDHFANESVNMLNREIMNNLVESNSFDLPEGFLKKWISREQEMTDEQFDAFIKEMKWRVIKKKLVLKHDVKVEENEILNHFVQMIRNYSPYIDEATLKNTVFSLMKNREQVNTAIETVSSQKLFDAIREVIKIEEKEISRDDFNERIKELNKKAE